jgi:sugar phosphate isomerase/epimerase
MKRIITTLIAALTVTVVLARAAAPEFFAMDTGTRDATHKTPEQQVDLVKESGFAGIAPIYDTPEVLRDTLVALDRHKLKMFAVYVPLNLDSPTPLSPAIHDTIAQLRGRDSVMWLHVKLSAHQPSDPAGDAKAVPVMREVADLAGKAGVRVSLYPHHKNWVERVEDGVRLARQVDRKNFGVTFNLCHWLMVDGVDLHDRLCEAKPHLTLVTINGADEGGKDWGKLIQPLGSGTYDVSKVTTKLAEIGWSGPVGLQHYGIKGDAKAILKRSMDAWRTMNPS